MDKVHDLNDRLNNMSVKEVIKEIKTYLVNPNTFIPSFIHWMNHFGLTDEIPRTTTRSRKGFEAATHAARRCI